MASRKPFVMSGAKHVALNFFETVGRRYWAVLCVMLEYSKFKFGLYRTVDRRSIVSPRYRSWAEKAVIPGVLSIGGVNLEPRILAQWMQFPQPYSGGRDEDM
jgi:hypothetical protein